MTTPSLTRLVIGFSPGSASDDIARAISPGFSAALGEAVDVVRRPGNNGADAAREVAASAPDGKTLFVATLGTHALAPHLQARLPYDPLRDFAPISLLTRSPLVLGVHASLGLHDVPALLEHVRAHPGSLAYGTSAIGGAPHLAAELFQAMTGTVLRHVRYAQTERLYEDLHAGRIALSFNNIMSMLPRCRDGAIRALALTTQVRSAAAPQLATLAESGVAGYDMSNWIALVAPKDTPAKRIERLHAALAAALADPAVRSLLTRAGVEPVASTPQALARFMRCELERWRPVVARFRYTAAAAPP